LNTFELNTFEYLQLHDVITDLCTQLAKSVNACVERELVKQVEILLGRVPSNDEVIRHGRRLIQTGNEWITFTWAGELLLAYRIRFTDARCVVEFKYV
jgi:hypothetical protein